jgi:pimeloyl-ACP methyl ester carboxylesterase
MLRRLGIGLVALLWLFGLSSIAEASRPVACHDVEIPVALEEGQPTDKTIFGRLCEPEHVEADSVQILLHGGMVSHGIWDLRDPSGGDDFSYVAVANESGYATLAIDRIGNGQSSLPRSSDVTIPADAYTVHQVVQALRRGAVTRPSGGGSFKRVVLVGTSIGTFVAWFEASQYQDVDAVVLTSGAHKIDVDVLQAGESSVFPAKNDPKFAGLRLDKGYVTFPTPIFLGYFYPVIPAPETLEAMEEIRGWTSRTEASGIVPALGTPLDIRVPAMVVVGSGDVLVCTSNASDCSSAEAFAAQEEPFLGLDVPEVHGFIVPDAGHTLIGPGTRDYSLAVQEWLKPRVPTEVP